MRNILLVEPDYKNKYPPLGLMKISTYHKERGDNVTFVKGLNPTLKKKRWDRIYISTLFTFHWKKTLETIRYYYFSVINPQDIYVGGVMATLLSEDLLADETILGINIISGLLDGPNDLDLDQGCIIDEMIPDYKIILEKYNDYLNYTYPTSDSYLAYATRGCIRKCSFCAVHKIEPTYKHYISLRDQIENINRNVGELQDKPLKHLLLMDNNILASDRFEDIINEIVELGYGVNNNFYTYFKDGRKITSRKFVDFNQGTDARLLTEENMELIARIAIKPLRIAFDHADEKYISLYTEKIRLAAKYNIHDLSNYVLYNYNDTPEELYIRLKINNDLNEEFIKNGAKTKIFSFPMRYSPIEGEHCKDRKYIGKNWTWKHIRAIQCILHATHGVVSPNPEFFYKAFGENVDEFKKLLIMPNEYIMNRKINEENGNIDQWWAEYNKLSFTDKDQLLKIVSRPGNLKVQVTDLPSNLLANILKHY